MGLEVSFSEEAYETLYAVLDFLEEKWGKNYSKKLLSNIYRKIDLISENPFIYEQTSIPGLRKANISNYTSLLYRLHNNEIRVMFFWDNRQEPLFSN